MHWFCKCSSFLFNFTLFIISYITQNLKMENSQIYLENNHKLDKFIIPQEEIDQQTDRHPRKKQTIKHIQTNRHVYYFDSRLLDGRCFPKTNAGQFRIFSKEIFNSDYQMGNNLFDISCYRIEQFI